LLPNRERESMVDIFEELAGLDRLIHEPPRLSILTALASVKRADLLFLQSLTEPTAGNLSRHLSKLEEADLIEIEKHFIDNQSNTLTEITNEGQKAIENHWRRLELLHKSSRSWRPDRDEETEGN
jgi:DNA-binding MarR family transcriptional regulator